MYQVNQMMIEELRSRESTFKKGKDYEIYFQNSKDEPIIITKHIAKKGRSREVQLRLNLLLKNHVSELTKSKIDNITIKILLKHVHRKDDFTVKYLLNYQPETFLHFRNLGPLRLSNLIKFFISQGFSFGEYPLLNSKYAI